MLKIYNTLARDKQEFVPIVPGKIGMYVCGMTVYDYCHLGHARVLVAFDMVYRWLKASGYDVNYVRNITDIDDKIIARSLQEDRSTAEVVATYEALWWEAMDQLGVARPDEAPHATDYVPEMIELISAFLEDDIAYTISDGVYLDVSRVPDYGLLAGQPLESLRVGARVEAVEEKRSPLDFALWKNAKPGEPSWPAPFGDGRPGWHTECVVMSLGLLGDDFDLHCGGLDLKFPHHENERAQAVAAGRLFSRHWSHNGLVMVGGEKMSKSLGNFTSLTNLAETSDPRAYRLLVLRSHYRSPVEVTTATIADAERALARLDAFARRFELVALAGDTLEVASRHEWMGEGAALYEEVAAVLDDDLKTPLAVAMLFDALAAANTQADAGDATGAQNLAKAINALFGALGLSLHSKEDDVDSRSADLVTRRDAARGAKDWAEADRLRNELVTLGWIVEDSSAGTLIRRP